MTALRILRPYRSSYGCLTATHRARTLARDFGGDEDRATFGPIAFAGPYVAYAFGIATKYMDGSTGVTVMNLRTGRRRAATAHPPDGRDYEAGVRDVRVNARGHAAYVVADGVPGRDASVVLLGPAGARVVDTALEPALRDLALTDDTLTWTDDGQPRSAAAG